MKRQTTRAALVAPLTLIGMLVTGHSHAGETSAQKREKELLQRLAKNQAQAEALQQRLDQLEGRVRELRSALLATNSMPTAARMVPAVATQPAATIAQASPPAKPAAPDTAKPAGQRAPGTFEVDEEAAQRALERTLTQSGALLLPPRTIEFTPSYTYRRNEQTTAVPATLVNSVTGASTATLINQRNRQNENTLRLDARAGLPYNAQLEFGLPYSNMRTSQVSDLGTTSSANGNGVGDVTLGIAKTLTREKGWKPDLIGRLTYNFGNGKRQDGGLTLNGGYRQVTAELVGLKRQDPLAFVVSTFYSKVFEKEGIKPGDSAGVSLSTLLAASPATSLQFGFSQLYRRKQQTGGTTVPGSDQTYGIATLGASSVLSRDLTLVTQLGIGLGNDAPKYSFTVSLPILVR